MNVENDPVDGFENDAVIVNVFKFNKCKACGVIRLLFGGEGGLDFFPICFCGCKAVVAVAHCKQQGRHFGAVLVGINKCVQRGDNVLDHAFIVDEPALNVSAVLHKVEIVELFSVLKLFRKGFDNGFLFIVDKNKNMGQLKQCAVANLQAGRDALNDRALGCADEGR